MNGSTLPCALLSSLPCSFPSSDSAAIIPGIHAASLVSSFYLAGTRLSLTIVSFGYLANLAGTWPSLTSRLSRDFSARVILIRFYSSRRTRLSVFPRIYRSKCRVGRHESVKMRAELFSFIKGIKRLLPRSASVFGDSLKKKSFDPSSA